MLSQMIATHPDLKKAITKVLNSIDSDLDIMGYEQSSDVDDALKELDDVLSTIDISSTGDDSDLVIKTKREPIRKGDENEDT